MELTAVNNTVIPKKWVRGIRIPEGYPMAGSLVEPCFCGEPMEFEAGYPIMLIQRHLDSELMLCHMECVRGDDADF